MKNPLKKLAPMALAAVAVFTGETVANAQYGADITTTGNDPDMIGVPGIGPRIFSDAGFTVRQATGSLVWFVASVDNNFNMDGTLGMDDTIIHRSYVDSDGMGGFYLGANVGAGAGSGYLINNADNGNALLGIPSTFANQNIAIFAFDVVTTPAGSQAYIPQSGDTFGFLNLGVNAPPPVGNAVWEIDQNIWTGQFVIPEPSTYALLALGGLGAFAYRRFRRE